MKSHRFTKSLLATTLFGIIAGATAASCSSSSFSGAGKKSSQKKSNPAPNEQDNKGKMTPSPTVIPIVIPPPTVVPPTVVELRVVKFADEAWYKNCLTFSVVNFPSTPVRVCNKPLETKIEAQLLKVNPDACNVIRIQTDTTFPTPGSCKKVGKSGWNCQYPDTPQRVRHTEVVSDRRFFASFDARTFAADILASRLNTLVRPIAESLVPSLLTAQEHGSRVFFEDLSDAEWDDFQVGHLLDEDDNIKIDYDDAVLEIVGNLGVKFAIEGSNFAFPTTSSPQQSQSPSQSPTQLALPILPTQCP